MHRHRIHGVHSVAREGSENSHVPVWNATRAMACQRFSAPTSRIRLFHSSAQQALLFFLIASKPMLAAKAMSLSAS